MTHVTNITAVETKRRKASLETKLKELLGPSLERQELLIEYLADPLDQVQSSTAREMAVQRLDYQSHLIHDVFVCRA